MASIMWLQNILTRMVFCDGLLRLKKILFNKLFKKGNGTKSKILIGAFVILTDEYKTCQIYSGKWQRIQLDQFSWIKYRLNFQLIIFRDGSACLSYNFDEKGTKIPVYHRRVEHSDDEYSVRNAQVRQRCQEACQALDLALTLNSCNDSQDSKLQNFCQTPGEADVFSMFR